MQDVVREENGQVAIEYALLIVLLVIATVISLIAVNGPAAQFFSDIGAAIAALG
jgi:Flp pilus assembly pilin Flp